ncbi:MAG: hypothetical protein KGJ53_07855 [Alphaproteobacteria bacterium]|nr:hypothetical protein [Alphaproteobacteria bacterium]
MWFCLGLALAGPWAEVGDAQLRSDIEVLAAAGVIDDITMQWPLPWGGILYRLDQPGALSGQPSYVVDAANRVLARGAAETQTHELRASATIDATNGPDVVRGFDAMGRQNIQGQSTLEYLWDSTAIHIAAGAETTSQNYLWNTAAVGAVPGTQVTGHKDKQVMLLDGSYLAQRIGNVAVYAGSLAHWWGPGWISALQLSNNARPFPQVGITRVDTTPFSSPWLSWIGPWQFDFIVGWLNGSRVAKNTLWDGLRFSVSPLPGLEIALARTQEVCGTGHPCKPIAEWLNIYNNNQHPGLDNGEGSFDIRYSGVISDHPFEIYAQFMNEDSSPIVHSGTSHLFGGSVWIPVRKTDVRLTAEYTSSIATKNIFNFGEYMYGYAYNDYKYVDGMRYRDRTLGFSLDNDSRLASLQASWMAPNSWVYTFTYHHAWIGSPNSVGANVISTAPVEVNIGEARLRMPLSWGALDLQGRLQDDQPRPDKGFKATVEAALTVNL